MVPVSRRLSVSSVYVPGALVGPPSRKEDGSDEKFGDTKNTKEK